MVDGRRVGCVRWKKGVRQNVQGGTREKEVMKEGKTSGIEI